MPFIPNRFYKTVSVVTRTILNDAIKCSSFDSLLTPLDLNDNNDKKKNFKQGYYYEIELDKKPLKTSAGKTLQLSSLPLALAIAQEWRSQQKKIDSGKMRLTGLAFTTIDNPLNETKESLTDNILQFLETDTLLYFAGNETSSRLLELQNEKWAPVIRWINERHSLELLATQNVADAPVIPNESHNRLKNFFLSHNFAALNGLCYGVEAVKSVLIVLATAGHYLDVENAVELSRLEQIFQTKTWGNVEWCHDIEHQELCSRLSASIIFAHLASNIQYKLESTNNN